LTTSGRGTCSSFLLTSSKQVGKNKESNDYVKPVFAEKALILFSLLLFQLRVLFFELMTNRVVLVFGKDRLGTLNNLLNKSLCCEGIEVLSSHKASLAWILFDRC
jgi:hypothetical protein